MRLMVKRPGSADRFDAQPRASRRVGVVRGALDGHGPLASLAALFPQVAFEPIEDLEADRRVFDIIVLRMEPSDLEAAGRWLRSLPTQTRALILLDHADINTSRQLIREGAADVLQAPATEASLALALERLFAAASAAAGGGEALGRVVALLKAGGGVGATSIGVQSAVRLAAQAPDRVCIADLDIQFGAAAMYLDLPDALNLADCLATGGTMGEMPFETALATHPSGARLLAAPKDIMPLESLGPADVEALLSGLRRDMALTLIDLPSAWTTWTSHVLQLADSVVLVTRLTVPHIQAVKRQLRMLASQQLDVGAVMLVCNSVSPDQVGSLSLKSAERALGRPFDVVIPEDARTMTAAINEGVALAEVRRGTKLEKALATFAAKLPMAPARTAGLELRS